MVYKCINKIQEAIIGLIKIFLLFQTEWLAVDQYEIDV